MFHSYEALQAFGDRAALLAGDSVTSYSELAAVSARFACRFPLRRGLIAIEMAPTPTTIAAYLGALRVGHAVMPMPEGQTDLALSLEARFRPAASWRRVGNRFRLLYHDRPSELHPDLALLMMTSGSTGQGRGVRLSRDAVSANASSIAEYLAIGVEDRAALVLPLHYSYGLSVLHSHLASGAGLWLNEGTILEPTFLPRLAESGATSLAGVPHHFRLLEAAIAERGLPAGLTCLTVAGGAMPAADVQRWTQRMSERRGRFVVMYGQTEATARISYLPHEMAAGAPDAIGRAIPGGRLSLRDDTGATFAEPGREGELIYRGPNVMMGYASDAADLGRGSETDELATGDLAVCGADGLYRITGRRSRMSKIAGLRVGHDALEQALAASGDDAAVWGDDERIWVATGRPSEALQTRVARLAGVGARHVVLVRCNPLPRRPNGKIDYPALKALASPPPPDKGLLPIFARTFAPQAVRRSDSFQSLGGDSLQHVELSLALDQHFGGLPEGWERRPIAELEGASTGPASRVPMPLLARALAILAVVVAHQTLWPVYGGAAAMVILLGMSVAEHRSRFLVEGETSRFLSPLGRVLIPYAVVLLGYAVAWQQIPWASVALIGNFAVTKPETHLMLPYLYWFVEAYVQMCLLLVVVFRLPGMRRWLARSLFGTGLFLLAIGVLLRVTLPELWPLPAGRSQFSVPWNFYLFALGWCIAAARSYSQRLVILVAAALILPLAAWLGGNWYGSWSKYLSLLGLAGVLLFVEAVPMPRVIVRGVMRLAHAAFPIYLLHRLAPEVLMPFMEPYLSPVVFDAVAILGGIALGVLAAGALSWLSRTLISLPAYRKVSLLNPAG
ncbi:AMP-binding protein [Defluviimonas salinarum]|uniref:AMP-binding protein n=1 Tax=Defluviimonas salinarum TaxID=2992147 RepID=A0ABT3J3N5_9RHOB|nr:AMP-binding protein [Defluviimonas salinarum]MCW3782300.1 AMP-binding protein [Defluviimonas salinarum]